MYCLTLWHMYTHETATTISVVNMFITFRRNFLLPVCDRFLPYLPTACPQGPLMSFPSLWVSSACIIGFSDSFLFFFFFWSVLGLHCCMSFSLVAESQGFSLVAVGRLLCCGFSCCTAQGIGCEGFRSCGSWALEHRLSSCGTQA